VCKKLGFDPGARIYSLRLPGMVDCKSYALKGLGVALMAKTLIHNELKEGKLIRLPFFEMKQPVYLISRNEKYESPTVSAFKEDVVKFCHELDRKWHYAL
jgi:DNA-binding transcriptional LysR family regulator